MAIELKNIYSNEIPCAREVNKVENKEAHMDLEANVVDCG